MYHNEPLSEKAIAERFCGASEFCFVQKLIKQYRLTQNIAPQTYRFGGQLKLNPEQLLVLAELIEASDDATLQELRYLLYQKNGFTIRIATMVRMA